MTDAESFKYCNTMMTQLYTFQSWSKSKSNGNGYGSQCLPYVGFPGLTLTPIPENPLVDSMQQDDVDSSERQKCLNSEMKEDTWNPVDMKKGSLPNHWIRNGSDVALIITEEDAEADTCIKTSKASSKTSSGNSPMTCLRKDEPLTTEQKRARLWKLLLFALCGFVIVAGIVLWIFSPAFS